VTVNSSLFSCTRIVHRTPVVETKRLHADYNLTACSVGWWLMAGAGLF
jgi:hypothetical protein